MRTRTCATQNIVSNDYLARVSAFYEDSSAPVDRLTFATAGHLGDYLTHATNFFKYHAKVHVALHATSLLRQTVQVRCGP